LALSFRLFDQFMPQISCPPCFDLNKL